MQVLIVLSALVAVACGQALFAGPIATDTIVKGADVTIAGPSGTIHARGGLIADNKGALGRALIAPTILGRSLVAPTLFDRSLVAPTLLGRSAIIGGSPLIGASPLIAHSTLGFDSGFIGDYGLGLGLNRGLYY